MRHSRKEILLIGLSGGLFLAGLLFRGELRDTPYFSGEILVLGGAYLLAGWNVLLAAARGVFRGSVFDENFLMTVATLGAFAIHEYPEAVGVMLFFKVGEYFQGLSVSRSRRSIQSLLELQTDIAHLSVDGELQDVPPSEVGVGAHIVVRPGERVPLDGEVVSGESRVDTSALTGEPVPRMARPGDEIFAGLINKTETLTVRVTKLLSESSVAKILHLVENAAGNKSKTENFITRFSRVYTPIVVAAALLVAVIPPLVIEGAAFSDWVYRALVVLVISCPCALVVSIPLGYFGGVGGASRRGILVKGSNFLDVLASVKTVVFDKTGTLTRGVFKVSEVVPCNGLSGEDLLRLAAVAESHSNHPIAQSIREAWPQSVNSGAVESYEEIAGEGIRARVEGREILAGSDRLMHEENIAHDVCRVENAGTMVHLAADHTYAGYIVIADELKDDVPAALRRLKALGVERLVMLTGDNAFSAENVARKAGVDDFRAELLPGEKVEALEGIMKETDGMVAYVGDGINDAPVIMRADVGMAMGELGSDAAIDTADVVLMTDAPSKVAEAIEVGRRTRKIVWQNIAFALGVKGVFILGGAAGIASMWGAVFADVGVGLLAVFNAARVLK